MKEKSSMCFISPSIIWISIHNTSLKCKHDYYCSSSFRNWGSSSSVVPEPNAALIRVTSETLHVQKVYCRYLKTVCWRLWSCTKQPQTLVIPYELRFPWLHVKKSEKSEIFYMKSSKEDESFFLQNSSVPSELSGFIIQPSIFSFFFPEVPWLWEKTSRVGSWHESPEFFQ